MKVKIFALVAAFFMLMGGSAWAQSDVKGDVNKDGVVNEQDIAAILAIMAKNNGVAEKTKYYWYVGNENPMNNGMATNINATSLTFTLNKSNGLLQTVTGYTDLIGKQFSFPNHFIIPTEWLDKIKIVNVYNMGWAWDTTVTDPTNKYTWCWNSGTGTGTFKIIAK